MNRQVEVALIPVFQFGVFSDSDLSFFAGPNLDFQGRVHTNGDMYLSEGTGSTVTFHDKVTVWGNVIRWELPNWTLTTAAPAHLGSVDILTASKGCDGAKPNCKDMGADAANPVNQGSITAGALPNTWTLAGQNPAWWAVSTGTYNGWIINGNYGNPGGTGAVKLSLPFVNGAAAAANRPQAFEIIRQPPAGEAPTSSLGSSRLYNEAQIRVLLADTPNDLPHPGYASGPAGPQQYPPGQRAIRGWTELYQWCSHFVREVGNHAGSAWWRRQVHNLFRNCLHAGAEPQRISRRPRAFSFVRGLAGRAGGADCGGCHALRRRCAAYAPGSRGRQRRSDGSAAQY